MPSSGTSPRRPVSYDLAGDTGWVNVGTDHNTAAFAAESIRRWWNDAGKDDYQAARRLLITADAGGSNSYRARTWKAALAALAAETGLEITCCHFPPGTSKWNKIEHRLFAHITMNWRGRPLTSHAVVLNSIAATTTATGLKVTAALDTGRYPTRIKITDEQMSQLKDRALTQHAFHGSWNYTVRPPAAGPAPAPRPAALRPRAISAAVTAALAHPKLTGMPRRDLAALAAALEFPFKARREQHLYTARGGPRRNLGWATRPYRGKLDLTTHLLATLLNQRLSLPSRQIAALLAVDPTTITDAVRLTRDLLADRGTTIKPAPVRLRTLADFRHYAHAAGIALPAEIKPAD